MGVSSNFLLIFCKCIAVVVGHSKLEQLAFSYLSAWFHNLVISFS